MGVSAMTETTMTAETAMVASLCCVLWPPKTVMKATPLKLNPPFRHPDLGFGTT